MRRTATFAVTEACNLACPYCYCKKRPREMSLEVAKAGVDFVLSEPSYAVNDNVVWDFIGGEPLLKAALISEILDYIHIKVKDHRWGSGVLASATTNGTLYHTEPVQRLLARHSCLNITMTIDGDQAAHDANRVYADGRGSWEDVVRNLRLWRQQYPKAGLSTKVTIGPNNLHLLADGILYLLSDLGIPQVHANCVFEDVWQPGDAEMLEHQMLRLGSLMASRGLKLDRCSLFDAHVGRPMDKRENGPWCGSGRYMVAIDPGGDLYPCHRFTPGTLAPGREPRPVGNVWDGYDQEALEPYLKLDRISRSPAKCIDCEVASGCAWCIGCDYDIFGDLNHRSTFICEMHQARARAIRALRGK